MGLNEVQKRERSEFLDKNLKLTECSQREPYVFISYASDNWETVFKSAIVPMQKQYGLRVYADKAFDKVNDKWIVPMLRNVRGADVFVAFISQSYIESYACFLELLTAVNNRKPLVVISLEEQLHLGDTTNLPIVNRGVKNEILNQGANIATNTNNTSNDIMRAMKSAFTSLSTLLEQDALSKYDITDAFINFLRDASLNRKTINDLRSVRKTIKSVSSSVFDLSLVNDSLQKPEQKVALDTAQKKEQSESMEEKPEPEFDSEPVQQVKSDSQPPSKPESEQKADFSFDDNESEEKAKKPLNTKLVGGVAAIAVAFVVLIFILSSGTKQVTNMAYTTSDGTSGTYTGDWKKKQPEGEGVFTVENGSVYEGEFKDGEYNGIGTFTHSDGSVLKGEFIDGKLNGTGTFTYSDGSVYEGEFKDSKFNGTGTLTYSDGSVYEGEFKDGEYNGTGTLTWSAGVYEGEFKDSKCYGTGTMIWSDGDTYEGEWKDDVPNGHGVYTWSDGQKFEGEWENGMRNGDGVYTNVNGTTENQTWINEQKVETIEWNGAIYTGTTKDGKPDGTGTLTYSDGSVYKGGFKDGKRSGTGTIIGSNGDTFEGEYIDDKRNGYGVYIWSSGSKYEGEYKDDKYNGQGAITYADGSIYRGEFVDGKKHGDGVYTRADGTIVNEKWEHGTKLN